MLNKLLGATALGVVMTAGLGLTAQAQVVDPDIGCRETGSFDVVDEDGKPERQKALEPRSSAF